MNSIIVTITDDKKSFYYDLDVPCNLPAEKLIQDIAETLNGLNPMLLISYIGAALVCGRMNRKINDNETLDDVGVRNGDYLIFSKGGQ